MDFQDNELNPELVSTSPHVSDFSGTTAEGKGEEGGTEEGGVQTV